ncbi:sigma-70 family RNA polymerase sigma factor [Planctomicrobium sp. SH668]|uniref:sigma-70 family RNA polymerase sigma factor n=1 Tax=Planctomicrobium sp. SH668 TaxID=3448126 RepID=UPI003F5AE24E
MSPQIDDQHKTFLRLFTANEAAIRAYVRRLVPLRSDADDIMQDVAVVLWEKFDEFRLDCEFRVWAFQIAKFKVLSWIRDQRRGRVVLANDVVELIAKDGQQFDQQLQQKRDALGICFEKIPSHDREILSRAYQPDAVIQQVAIESGRTVSGFYQWLYRMRLLLQECVQRELKREVIS